jgi:hypothetical protein
MSMGFVEAAKQAFSFLERDGFRLTKSEPGRVQFDSNRMFVAIEWEARSGELEVFFGLPPTKGGAPDAFSLRDLLGMEDVDVPEREMPFQVSEEGKLRPFIDKLADDAKRYAQPALAGDRMYFRRLHAYRSTQAETYMRNMEVRRVRMEAEKAWKERQLDKLIRLYTSIEDHLTASERAKLAYARQHETQ